MQETPEKKATRFELRLEKAKNPRCRKYNRRQSSPVSEPLRSRTNLQAAIEDIRNGDLAVPRYEPYITGGALAGGVSSGIECGIKAATFVASAAVADIVESTKSAIRARKAKASDEAARKLQQKNLELRRKYYAKETERRRLMSEAIRAAIPPPKNPMPTAEALIHAYVHRHVGEAEAMRFGSLLIDLEEHVRRTVAERDKNGRITGLGGGVRKWLKANCPELLPHYHTCQRFKRKAQPDRE